MSTSGRRVLFTVGEAFPADSPVAVFVTTLSMAYNDLMLTNLQLVGGDKHGPGMREVPAYEGMYLLRVSCARLYEFRQTIRYARRQDEVARFIADLPPEALADLASAERINRHPGDWLEKALRHVRNQSSHYGGKYTWDDERWALETVADLEDEIEMANDLMSGMRLKFADLVTVQHFTRMIPEQSDLARGDLDDAVLEARMAEFVSAVADATTAALRFIAGALHVYLSGLPDGVLRFEEPA